MFTRYTLLGSVLAAALLVSAAPASALPGDPGISAPNFRLNDNTLEPGCFVPGRNAPVDVDGHLVFSQDGITGEVHVTVSDGAAFSIDQVLAPSPIDGYNVVNTFDTGTVNSDPDIDPGQTATGITSPTRFVAIGDLIICLSNHGDAVQNEPYNQEAGGLVSAINRPIVVPKVTALGVSAITVLNTYKIGFGYSIEKWYTRPAFETTEDGNALFPSVTDPNAVPSPTFGSNLPFAVVMRQRLGDLPYDARRVNDVDKAGESWTGGNPDDGQDVLLRQSGDLTAWTDSGGNGLLTTLTQGDLPISWELRASLAGPGSHRKVTFTDDMLRAWNASWQAYYLGKGPKPTLPLAPGTNSPTPNTSVVVNLPESSTSSATSSTLSQTVTSAVAAATRCVSTRAIKVTLTKGALRGTASFNGKTAQAKKSNGRLKAPISFKGLESQRGQWVLVRVREKVKTKAHPHGTWKTSTRVFKLC